MFSKIIFALAAVCVVNASMLAVNGNDDPQTEVASSPKKCNYQECHQRCRRLKFPGGSCVNGRCKCDNFLNAEDGDSENSPSYLENSVLQQDYPETEVKAHLSGCNNKVCDWVCRRLNKTNGTCVNGRCKCGRSLVAEDAMKDLDESISPDDNFLSTEGFRTQSCNMQACHQLCRSLKLRGGVCVNGRCKCDYFFRTEDAIDEYSGLDTRRDCKIIKCNRKCTRRGYEGATCVDGRCKCYKSLETSLPVSELSEDQTERSCKIQACDQLCRLLKFPAGACVNGHCKCDNSLGTEDGVNEYSELNTRRICDKRKCNLTCTRRGYASSRCVNGWCHCYDKIQKEDASPLSDVTSDEYEESKDMLRTNEDELIEPPSNACNTVTCN